MVDLLTHVLVGYVLATVLSWRHEALSDRFVTVAMAGALLPDLNRVALVVSSGTVETLLGVPWSWTPLHRVGGTALIIAIGALLVPRRHRRLAVATLLVGAGSHYLLDYGLYQVSGLTGPLLWPFTDARFAFEGLYLSSDRWPAAVATAASAAVWALDRRIGERNRGDPGTRSTSPTESAARDGGEIEP